jgi:hypothetical protein
MSLNYRETSVPVSEPVTLAQAHSQLTLDSGMTTDDTMIRGMIQAAREYCEKLMQRAIYPRNVTLSLDNFPIPVFGDTLNPADRNAFFTGTYIWNRLAIRLPLPACQSVTSITYYDQSGTQYTVDPTTYIVDTMSEPCRIVPKWSCTWPVASYYQPGSIQVNYVAGTWATGSCPMAIQASILMLVSHWYNNRDAAMQSPPKEVEHSVRALLAGHVFECSWWNQ